jgi:hypothetical protein
MRRVAGTRGKTRSQKRPRQFHNSNATRRKHPAVRPAPKVAGITTVRSPSKRNCPIFISRCLVAMRRRVRVSAFGSIQPCAPSSPASFGYGFHNQLQSGCSASLSGIPVAPLSPQPQTSRDYPGWPRKPHALKADAKRRPTSGRRPGPPGTGATDQPGDRAAEDPGGAGRVVPRSRPRRPERIAHASGAT